MFPFWGLPIRKAIRFPFWSNQLAKIVNFANSFLEPVEQTCLITLLLDRPRILPDSQIANPFQTRNSGYVNMFPKRGHAAGRL
jgi:hypothetical protein